MHRHKMACMATEASQRLEFGIKESAYGTLSSHLHNKRIKTAYYIECTVYKRTDLLIVFHQSSMYSIL